jgi:hypothetical protein
VCLASLSFSSIGSRYKRVEESLAGTCQWIFRNAKYLEWLTTGISETRRSFLWIKGKAGSGKSTLMKAIIRKIRALPSRPVVISFFFDARGNLLERSPLGLFRTLIKALIDERPQLLERLLSLFETMLQAGRLEWQMHDLLQWFKQTVEDEQLGPVYVFIDALDECDQEDADQRTTRVHETNARTLVRFFENLMTSSTDPRNPLLLCLSSRHYPHITVRNDVGAFEVWMEGENDQDIRKFIKSTLIYGSLDTDLMQDGLLDMIAQRSRGVFLWTVLVIQALLGARDQGRPRSQWRAILEGLPKTLNEMFRLAMSNLKDEDRFDSAILFQLLILGQENMSLLSLRHAFAFTIDEPPVSLDGWERSDVYLPEEAFRKRIRDLSCGLVEVKNGHSSRTHSTQENDIPSLRANYSNHMPKWTHNGSTPEDQTVQFIHETVRTFFVKNDYAGLAEFQSASGESQSANAYDKVIRACLNYIATTDALDSPLHMDGSTQYVSCVSHYPFTRMPFLKYAAGWIHDYMGSAETLSSERRQIELYRSFGGPSNKLFKVWKAVLYCLRSVSGRGEHYLRYKADFFDYAATTGLSYSVSAGLRDRDGKGPRISKGITPLMRLLIYQCDDGARTLVAQGIDVRARDDYGRSVLFYARSTEMVDMLLDAGAEVNGIWIPPRLGSNEASNEDDHPGTGLNALMHHIGDARMVGCLIRHGADVNETSALGETALHFAPSEAVARLILSKRPDRQKRDLLGSTASDRARDLGRNEVARLIDECHEENGQCFT